MSNLMMKALLFLFEMYPAHISSSSAKGALVTENILAHLSGGNTTSVTSCRWCGSSSWSSSQSLLHQPLHLIGFD